jgi:TolB-like protein
MMAGRRKIKLLGQALLGLAILGAWLPAMTAAGPMVAVFPLQELSARGGSDVNLPLTRTLAEHLAANGNEISSLEVVIAFMAHNRIRAAGHLESFHITRVREELGAAFILLGTISQRQEQPVPALGLTLQLVRTHDARTVWSYIGHLSSADTRRVLAIGEPRSVAELLPLLLQDIMAGWPWEIIGETQQAATVSLDSVLVQPAQVRPGDEVSARVRLRDEWLIDRAPRVFFQADDQLHAAARGADNTSYEAFWVAGEKDGRFPVTLILEWPLYGRRETVLLGAYVVDGVLPLLELEFRGTQSHGEIPVFRDQLQILPRMLVRKPAARWRLAFHNEAGNLVGVLEDHGNLPEHFIWKGQGSEGPVRSGIYRVMVEVWDLAGNSASVSRQVELNREAPAVALALDRNGREMRLDLEHQGRIPLAFWRMEMWTREGQMIKTVEGQELPAQVGIELPPGAMADEKIEGLLVVQDILGNRARRDLQELFLPAIHQPAELPEEKPAGFSETWVDEF